MRFNDTLIYVTISISPVKSVKYFATFLVDTANIKKESMTESIGLNLVFTHFYIIFASKNIGNMKFYRSLEKLLGLKQRNLLRRFEATKKHHRKLDAYKNYQKKIKNARIHERVYNQRNVF